MNDGDVVVVLEVVVVVLVGFCCIPPGPALLIVFLQDREDFSQTKKHMLNKLSDEEKWELMGQYAGSTLELMVRWNGIFRLRSIGICLTIMFLCLILKEMKTLCPFLFLFLVFGFVCLF